jgi:hypothetical protein
MSIELKNLKSVLIEYTYYLKDDMIDNEKSFSELNSEESVTIFLNQWKKKVEERIKKELEAIEAKKKELEVKKQLTKS